MKFRWCLFLLFLHCHSCFAQGNIETGKMISEKDYYYPDVIAYVERQTDIIALNSVIEVNGIPHPRDTYGYIDYRNTEGAYKRCFFLHLKGIIAISKKEYEEIVKLPDSAKVEIAICLQSPVNGDWGGSWDKVIVKGIFDASQLVTSRNMLSPCFHFVITSIGKELFKIQFHSWAVQTYYYSTNSTLMTRRQRKWLDRKEHKMYKESYRLHFERELW